MAEPRWLGYLRAVLDDDDDRPVDPKKRRDPRFKGRKPPPFEPDVLQGYQEIKVWLWRRLQGWHRAVDGDLLVELLRETVPGAQLHTLEAFEHTARVLDAALEYDREDSWHERVHALSLWLMGRAKAVRLRVEPLMRSVGEDDRRQLALRLQVALELEALAKDLRDAPFGTSPSWLLRDDDGLDDDVSGN
jgi:hypothetical protein